MEQGQRYISRELSHFVGRGKAEEEQYDLLVNHCCPRQGRVVMSAVESEGFGN